MQLNREINDYAYLLILHIEKCKWNLYYVLINVLSEAMSRMLL